MPTTFGPPMTPHLAGVGSSHDAELGCSCLVSAWPLTAVAADKRPPLPSVRVAAEPQIEAHSVTVYHRHHIARSREHWIEVWVGCVMLYVTGTLCGIIAGLLF
jgi:hypothetical protein